MFWYYFFNLLTMPGVVVHELAHALFCLLSGVKIHQIKLFQFGKVAGFVVHDEPHNFLQGFLISFGPLIINSALAMFLFALFNAPWARFQPWVAIWAGVAIGSHAIPSTGDASSLLQMANHRFWHNPLVIVAYPLVLVLYILNILKRLHVDIVFVGLLFWLGRFYLKA